MHIRTPRFKKKKEEAIGSPFPYWNYPSSHHTFASKKKRAALAPYLHLLPTNYTKLSNSTIIIMILSS